MSTLSVQFCCGFPAAVQVFQHAVGFQLLSCFSLLWFSSSCSHSYPPELKDCGHCLFSFAVVFQQLFRFFSIAVIFQLLYSQLCSGFPPAVVVQLLQFCCGYPSCCCSSVFTAVFYPCLYSLINCSQKVGCCFSCLCYQHVLLACLFNSKCYLFKFCSSARAIGHTVS